MINQNLKSKQTLQNWYIIQIMSSVEVYNKEDESKQVGDRLRRGRANIWRKERKRDWKHWGSERVGESEWGAVAHCVTMGENEKRWTC
jgi:hypothetical protein